MQHLLMAMLLHLGGGQRLQVYANILVKDLIWKEGKLLLVVPAEKVPRLHGTLLPLPAQLHVMLEFFKQHVRPHLLRSVEDDKDDRMSLWLNRHGGALSPSHFSRIVTSVYQEFNGDLTITPTDFRRNTVTKIFAGEL